MAKKNKNKDKEYQNELKKIAENDELVMTKEQGKTYLETIYSLGRVKK